MIRESSLVPVVGEHNIDGPNRYLLVRNDPVNKIDYFGLKDCGALLDAAWEAAKTATPGGEFVSVFEIFGNSCNSLGLCLAWAKTQYNDCLADAICGDPKKEAAAEKACDDKWKAKINLLQNTYDKYCKGANKK